MSEVTLDMRPLEEMLKEFKNPPHVDVGILGDGSKKHPNSQDNNATIGAYHEYGSLSAGIPERSFIQMPITEKVDDIATAMKRGFDPEDPIPMMKNAGVAAEAAIHEAFASQGFGKWEPLSPNYKKRPSGQPAAGGEPLRDTGELERAITSKVGK